MHADQKYIDYLKSNDALGIQSIYTQFGKKVVRMICFNNGSEDDAYDILQESLVDIYHMGLDKNYQLTTSFESFLLMVCKRKWLNALKKAKQIEVTKSTDDLYGIEDVSDLTLQEELEHIERENEVMRVLATLGDRCQEIIKRCITEKHQEQIALSLGVTYAYLRKKKSECMATLMERVNMYTSYKTKKS